MIKPKAKDTEPSPVLLAGGWMFTWLLRKQERSAKAILRSGFMDRRIRNKILRVYLFAIGLWIVSFALGLLVSLLLSSICFCPWIFPVVIALCLAIDAAFVWTQRRKLIASHPESSKHTTPLFILFCFNLSGAIISILLLLPG